VLLFLAACASPRPVDSETTRLFNGRDLTGWRAIGDARWSVEDGELVGRVGGGHQSFLVTQAEYSDFVLELELKSFAGNSGVQVRSHQREDDQVFGYQVEVDSSPRAWSGGLYDEGRRAWLVDLSDRPEARAAFRPGEWNRYRIELVGPRIRTWVNDVPIVDTTDDADATGFIGLQVHSGSEGHMRFRGITLRRVP
jgi:hypothetical protein